MKLLRVISTATAVKKDAWSAKGPDYTHVRGSDTAMQNELNFVTAVNFG